MKNYERVINIHYGEIALKGRNRAVFENKLVSNINAAVEGLDCTQVQKMESRLVLKLKSDSSKSAILTALSRVFGIEWYAPAILAPAKMDEIQDSVFQIAKPLHKKTLKIETSRSDKSFPIKSPDISRNIGMKLEESGFLIDIPSPQEIIFIEIMRKGALITSQKQRGLGGLPVGSSGKVLSLLSGGIDSPVSSYLMMKRGCSVDFLHMHSFAKNTDAEKSKMKKIIEQLRMYSPGPVRLFLASYMEFYKKSFEMPPKIELVLFRRFILRLASRLAEENGYLGLVTGDSVGQVASQTLGNLRTTTEAASFPVYRPLVAYDKQEIINLAKKIGTYETSIEEYKDCCSLVAQRHPNTNVKLEAAEKAEKEIEIEKIVEKTLEQIKVVEI